MKSSIFFMILALSSASYESGGSSGGSSSSSSSSTPADDDPTNGGSGGHGDLSDSMNSAAALNWDNEAHDDDRTTDDHDPRYSDGQMVADPMIEHHYSDGVDPQMGVTNSVNLAEGNNDDGSTESVSTADDDPEFTSDMQQCLQTCPSPNDSEVRRLAAALEAIDADYEDRYLQDAAYFGTGDYAQNDDMAANGDRMRHVTYPGGDDPTSVTATPSTNLASSPAQLASFCAKSTTSRPVVSDGTPIVNRRKLSATSSYTNCACQCQSVAEATKTGSAGDDTAVIAGASVGAVAFVAAIAGVAYIKTKQQADQDHELQMVLAEDEVGV